jgi:LysM repeat protein
VLALIAFIVSFALGTFGVGTPSAVSQLPRTQPGSGSSEGVFLVTAADDGSRANYFIAGGQRHSILTVDMQVEIQLNPLWPVHNASQEDVLEMAEGAPIGAARTGLLGAAPAAAPEPEPAPVSDDAPAQLNVQVPSTATYVLRPGDNLTRISAQYGTSVEAILGANGIANPNRVYVGQTLVIPTMADSVVEAPVEAAPPVADDTSDIDADVADAADAATTYTVRMGDSAFLIARQFGVAQGDLLTANGITNPNRVYVGQVLTIPQ